MKKYDKYKDSGIEWIGEIPEHWEVKSLKRLAKICNGQDHKEVWDENGIYPIFGTGGEFGKANKYLHKGTSVLLGRKGTIDKPQYIQEPFWSVDTAYYTEIKPDVNPKLFYYLCTTIRFDFYKYGSAVPSMTQEVLSQIPFPISLSYEEQTAIANYLDRKTAEIDQLIDAKKRLIELYHEEKTAIINQAVTKGINPNAKMKDSGIEWLGEIPEHWEVKRLKTMARVQTGGTPKIQGAQKDYFSEGTINWFTPGDFNEDGNLKGSNRKVNKSAVLDNEVEVFPEKSVYLVCIGATLGKVGICNEVGTSNQQINIIVFDKEKTIPEFGYYYILGNKEMILNEADYTTLPIFNQSKTKNLLIALPHYNEQQSIVHHIETECSRIDTKIERTQRLIELLAEYRTALISEVVTGKVKVV